MHFRGLLALSSAFAFSILAITVGCLGDDPEKVTETPDGGNAGTSSSSSSGTSGAATSSSSGSTSGGTSSSSSSGVPGQIQIGNGDFAFGCTGWVPDNSQLNEIAEGRSNKACKICGVNLNEPFRISQAVKVTMVPGEAYAAKAWVRSDGVNPPVKASVFLRTEFEGSGVDDGQSDKTISVPTTTWQEVEGSVLVKSDAGTDIAIYISGDPRENQTDCLFIDDVVFFKK